MTKCCPNELSGAAMPRKAKVSGMQMFKGFKGCCRVTLSSVLVLTAGGVCARDVHRADDKASAGDGVD